MTVGVQQPASGKATRSDVCCVSRLNVGYYWHMGRDTTV